MPREWSISRSKILTRNEILDILRDMKRRRRRSLNSRQNLVIFRLATCCGLRASEICQLRLRDLVFADAPYIHLPAPITKYHRPRDVPLWWDEDTLIDLQAWVQERRRQGARPDDLLIISLRRDATGHPRNRHGVRISFMAACRCINRKVTIHHGRHSFASHALAAGKSLPEVRDAMGHNSVQTTSTYLHLANQFQGIERMFGE